MLASEASPVNADKWSPANPRSEELPGFQGREPGQRSLGSPGGRFVIGIPRLNQGGATDVEFATCMHGGTIFARIHQ